MRALASEFVHSTAAKSKLLFSMSSLLRIKKPKYLTKAVFCYGYRII